MLITGSYGSGKESVLLKLISYQQDIYKIHLYAKDFNEPKYQLIIVKRGDTGIKYLNHSRAFKEFSNTIEDVKNIHHSNPKRKRELWLCLLTWMLM